MSVRAKFICTVVSEFPSGDKKVEFSAVVSGSDENKEYAKYTPDAQMSMTISPETKAIDFFKSGKEYVLDIKEAT